jgi:AraC-like DNA-binding protein
MDAPTRAPIHPDLIGNAAEFSRFARRMVESDDGSVIAAMLDMPRFQGRLGMMDTPSITIVLQGTSHLSRPVEGRERHYRLGPGSFGLVLPGDDGFWRWDRMTTLVLGFPASWLTRAGRSGEYHTVAPRRSPIAAAIIDKLAVALDRQDVSPLLLEGAILVLLSELAIAPGAGEAGRRLSIGQIRRIDAHLDERLGKPISVDDLAVLAGYSKYHFLRLFKAATGMTPARYVMLRRIEAAQAMLDEGKRSASDIALETGFSSAAHFSDVFRKVTGSTPTAWTAEMRRRETT